MKKTKKIKCIRKRARENRKAQRIHFSVDVAYKPHKKKNKLWEHAHCKDISGMGIGLCVKSQLKADEKVKVSIRSDDNTLPVLATCRVIWCVKTEEGSHKAGLEVIEVNDPVRFTEFICDKIINLSLP